MRGLGGFDRKSAYRVLGTFLAVDGLGLPIESSSYERGNPNVWG